MKKLFVLALFLVCLKPSVLLAQETAPVHFVVSQPVPITNKEYVQKLVTLYAQKYNVSASALMHTIQNENGNFDFSRQSNCVYAQGNRWGFPAGAREKSYGLAMIHLPDHPNISYDQATDPEFAVAYMAKEFSKGHQGMWMGYRE